ncbi:MAG: thiamine pyrophosphate-dependent enzyme [Huintestinicola sp.]
MKKTVSGNEAIAYGALRAGVKVVSGYPGTPSTEVITSLLKMDLPGTYVEWSTNEKTAFEVAAGASLAGSRALCTMKMSGLNVAYDSLIGIAYSGCKGGLVIYVADDPGVTAGMCEQDTRGFAVMSDMPMLEPCSVEETYELTKFAFELSEEIAGPVFIRLVTNNSQSHACIEIEDRVLPPESQPLPVRDTAKFTKAGAAICMKQHTDLIARLAKAEEIIAEKDMNKLTLGKEGGVGVVSVGITNGYTNEALESLSGAGVDVSDITTLELIASIPFAKDKLEKMLSYCSVILVAEELEGHIEKYLYMQAYKMGANVKIIGKEDGTYKRIGEYDAQILRTGICKAMGIDVPECFAEYSGTPEDKCTKRPIGFCAGCPHRGTYMGIEAGLKKAGLKKKDVFITGDIGCTILGISPPFNILWTELAMGASIPLAQGFGYANIPSPIIATIGDSTFFHAGMTGLVNAVQHHINMTVVILDNGWTAMTGMQVNPGTIQECQMGQWQQLDLINVVKGLGISVDNLYVVDPYDHLSVADAVKECLGKEGVKVILSRRECAIEAARRKVKYSPVNVIPDKCIMCRKCINVSGCPAITLGKDSIEIDKSTCNNCGLCTQVCPVGAIEKSAE